MDTLARFIPMDRRQALARGEELPDRLTGAALCADITGFTLLTETLALSLGAQRGAEELAAILNRVYSILTAEIDRYGGSVIGFSGDAVTCWFDGDDARRATTCALRLLEVMAEFSSLPLPTDETARLEIKVAVAQGGARRFLIGQAHYRRIEVLAGATIDRLAAAEQIAHPGELVLDPAAAARLASDLAVAQWRGDGASGDRYAIVRDLTTRGPPQPWPPIAPSQLNRAVAQSWLLPEVYNRLQHGLDEFLTELRPAVSLFVHFSGIDYDNDDCARVRLDGYIGWVQEVAARYEGSLLQVTIGEKGSFLYIAFGAPYAHADDAARAVDAALELRTPPGDQEHIHDVRIGISAGRARAGIYGGTTCTYGVLGDAVNLAARLMQAADLGQILIDAPLSVRIARRYALQPLPPIQVKGKGEPVAIAQVIGPRPHADIQPWGPAQPRPFVGRTRELEQIDTCLWRVLGGQGQVVAITAEAGIGKSRLVAEVARRAAEAGLGTFGGEGHSYGMRSAYLAWRPLWRTFFNLDAAAPAQAQAANLERALAEIDPTLLPRLPLLGAVLDLPIAESDLVNSMDLSLRKESLEQMLVGCLRARAADTPLLLVLEDAHWLDPLSIDLLTAIGHAMASLPILLVIARRPPEENQADPLPVLALPHAIELRLGELTISEAQELLGLRARELFDTQQAPPPEFANQLIARAQGNPFYIEELLNYAWSSGLAARSRADWAQADLPDSLTSLILSRIDQLTGAQQMTLKVASVIGRTFPVAWLWGVHPNLGPAERVGADLEELARLNLATRAASEPESRYVFKHVLIQEIAYESLPFAFRAQLHNQLARWLEQHADAEASLDLLAFHYGRSANLAKQREYYRRAGDTAAARFANTTAIDYYERLLALLATEDQGDVLVLLGDVLKRTSTFADADAYYREALAIADTIGDSGIGARAQLGLGTVQWRRGEYAEALDRLERARATCAALGDSRGSIQALLEIAQVFMFQGESIRARAASEEIRALALAQGDLFSAGRATHLLGNLAANRGELAEAHALWLESIELKRAVGDTMGVAATLANMGLRAHDAGQYEEAQALVEESLSIYHEAGARQKFILVRSTLAQIRLAKGDLAEARRLLTEDLGQLRELGARWEMALDLVALAEVALAEAASVQQARYAARLNGAAAGLLASIGATFFVTNDRARVERIRTICRSILGQLAAEAAWNEGQAMDWPEALNYALGSQPSSSNERSRAA